MITASAKELALISLLVDQLLNGMLGLRKLRESFGQISTDEGSFLHHKYLIIAYFIGGQY